jgi:hypothetical protein
MNALSLKEKPKTALVLKDAWKKPFQGQHSLDSRLLLRAQKP